MKYNGRSSRVALEDVRSVRRNAVTISHPLKMA